MPRRWIALIGVVVGLQGSAASAEAWQDWPGEWRPGRPSVAASLGQGSAFIGAPSFRLEVPFRTQKDGGPWQTSNCGPAALGMVLDGYGVAGQTTDDLRFRSHTYQGTVGRRTGTALQHLAQVAEDLGVPTSGLYNEAGQFNAWSLDDIRGQLRLGRPVIPLVRLYLLPGNEQLGTRWGHYVLLTGLTEDGFFYNDPLKVDPTDGRGRYLSAGQLERAIRNSHIPGQALAFGGPNAPPLPVWLP